MKKIQILMIVIIFSGLFMSACAGEGAKTDPTPVPTPVVPQKPTYNVQRGTVSKVLELRGRVSPVQQQDLYFGGNGFVTAVMVKRGDEVKAGDLLALLGEREAIEATVADANLEVLKAQNALDKLHEESSLKSAEAHLAYLEAQKELEKAENNRYRMDFRRGSDASIEAARADYLVAEDSFKNAESDYYSRTELPSDSPERVTALVRMVNSRRVRDSALANLNYLQSKPGEKEIEEADVQVEIARAKLEAAQREYERLKDGPDPFDVLMAEAVLQRAQANLNKASASLENLEIRAPFDGQVLSVSISPGSQVTSYQNVITLADPDHLEIVCLPSPDELSQLSVGQSATVRLSSQPGVELAAELRQMPVTGLASTTTSAQSRDQSVRLQISDADANLTLGEAATAIIFLDERTDTLWLAPGALRTFQGRDFVIVQDGDLQRRVDLRLGLRSTDRIEVLEGLEEGQVVIGP